MRLLVHNACDELWTWWQQESLSRPKQSMYTRGQEYATQLKHALTLSTQSYSRALTTVWPPPPSLLAAASPKMPESTSLALVAAAVAGQLPHADARARARASTCAHPRTDSSEMQCMPAQARSRPLHCLRHPHPPLHRLHRLPGSAIYGTNGLRS